MNTEEKAKAYDEALKKARQLCGYPTTKPFISDLQDLFPELCESEDERMKKSIIQTLKKYSKCVEDGNDSPSAKDFLVKDIENQIAWLEKQGDNNNEDADILQRFSFYSYKDEPNVLYLSNVFVNEEYRNKGIGTKILKIADEVSTYLKCNSIRLKTENGSNAESLYRKNGYKTLKEEGNQIWLEKQGEQSLANKVEPKFHEGEWITNGDYTWKIVEIEPLDYILQSQEGNIVDDTISHVDEQFHSFTIKDAKDGDVLVASDSSIFIFKEVCGSSCKHYIALTSDKEIQVNTKLDKFWETARGVKPSTKEQRDTLLKAMADAGYTFNFEKKELKKIKQKSQRMVSAEAKEALYEKPTDEEMKELLRTEYEKGRADTIAEIEKDWSEEDETGWTNTMIMIKEVASNHYTKDSIKLVIDWLKSLKDRYTWKPSEEQIECLHDAINHYHTNGYPASKLNELYEQMSKIYKL